MTESELIESAALFYQLAIAAMVFYLSVVTGYLIAAHLVGAKLARSQAILVTCLFVFFALFSVWGSVAFFMIGSHFYHEAETSKLFLSKQWVPAYAVIGTGELLGVIASLHFMHNLRKKQRNRANEIDA